MFNVNKNFTECQQKWKEIHTCYKVGKALILSNTVQRGEFNHKKCVTVLRTLSDIVKISVEGCAIRTQKYISIKTLNVQ